MAYLRNTQFIWLGSCQELDRLDITVLTAAFPHLTFSSAVHNLGVTPGRELTFAPVSTSLTVTVGAIGLIPNFGYVYRYMCDVVL